LYLPLLSAKLGKHEKPYFLNNGCSQVETSVKMTDFNFTSTIFLHCNAF